MLVPQLAAPGTFRQMELAMPEPQAGEVRVRIGAVSICGSDLSAYRGWHPRIRPPVVLGHESAGVVDAVGPDVRDVEIGTRVAVEPTLPCRECRYCRQGRANICIRYRVVGEGSDLPGAFAGHVVVPADRVHPLPDRVTLDEGALVQPMAIGLHAVRHRAEVTAADTVLVVGAGAIGLAVLLECRARGARTFVADVVPQRLALASKLGAEVALDPTSDDVEAVIRDHTEGDGADATFEAAGGTSEEPFDLAVRATARAGRLITLGSFGSPALRLRQGDVKTGEMAILGSQAHPNSFPDTIAGIADGKLPVEELITHRLPMSEVEEAFRLLADRSSGAVKIVLRPPGSRGDDVR